jgi:hypothetical protein
LPEVLALGKQTEVLDEVTDAFKERVLRVAEGLTEEGGVIEIHKGQTYEKVAFRVIQMRADEAAQGLPPKTIKTKVEFQDAVYTYPGDNPELVKPAVYLARAKIIDVDGRVLVTATAETRATSLDDRMKCETKAVGRALGFLGYGQAHIATAEEMEAQEDERAFDQWVRFSEKVREHWESIVAVKLHLALKEWEQALEAWNEIDYDDKRILWRAPSKGGVFTTKERQLIHEKRHRDAAEAEE